MIEVEKGPAKANRNTILESKLNKINETFEITESVICSMEDKMNSVILEEGGDSSLVKDLYAGFYSDFTTSRENLRTTIEMTKKLMETLSVDVQLGGDSKATSLFASLVNSMNNSIRLLNDIYFYMVSFELQHKKVSEKHDDSDNIADKTKKISANLSDILKQLKKETTQ